ncbi:MAG: hypothetical protein AAGD43_07965 [Pseudomonadota bacterium]
MTDCEPYSDAAHERWRAELIAEHGEAMPGVPNYPDRCIAFGFAVSRVTKAWPREPCQTTVGVNCTCHNNVPPPLTAEQEQVALLPRQAVVAMPLSDEAWALLSAAYGNQRDSGRGRTTWREAWSGLAGWANSDAGWYNIYLRAGEDNRGNILRQRVNRLEVFRLHKLRTALEQDSTLDEIERQRLITTTHKLIQHINKANRARTKTASEMAAEV